MKRNMLLLLKTELLKNIKKAGDISLVTHKGRQPHMIMPELSVKRLSS